MGFIQRGKLVSLCFTESKLDNFFVFIYITTFFIALPIICADLHHSIYNFRRNSKYEEMINMELISNQRLAESQQTIFNYKHSLASHNQSDSLLQSRDTVVGITVVTVSRNQNFKNGFQPQYLTQVVGRLLDLINISNTKLNYDIFICNVDSDPDSYKEATYLKSLFTHFQKYKKKNDSYIDIFEKEKLDYIFCMEETLKRDVSFAFMIEDDAYPHKDLFPVLENIIGNSGWDKTPENKIKATFVKFYHPERLLGYISLEIERLPELAAFSFVLGSLLTLFCLYFIPSGRKFVRSVWIKSAIYFCLIALTVGRVNLIEMRRISTQMYQLTPTPSCCTQAMLFPEKGARNIIHHLKKTLCYYGYGKDITLDDIWRRENYKALMVQPNLFNHIGLYSTIRKRVIDPFALE